METKLTDSSNNGEVPNYNIDLGELSEQLQTIKRKFETEYYGRKPLGKYDLARNFSIRLNAIAFKVNGMSAAPNFSEYNLPISKSDKANFYSRQHSKISDQSIIEVYTDIQNLHLELGALIDHGPD